MVKYSRTAKYEELRTQLQNDSESSIHSRDLNNWLANNASPEHFDSPQANEPEEVTPVHARRSTPYPEPQPVQMPAQETAAPGYSKEFFKNGANYTTAFNNEYLDEYIREVKKYNIDQGFAQSANTDLDILQSLKGDTPRPAPKKPYPDETVEAAPKPAEQPAPVVTAVPKPEPKPEPEPEPVKPAVKPADTADISFGSSSKPQPAPVVRKPVLDFLDDEDEEFMESTPSDTRAMTKEDIAAEVQRLIKNAQQNRDNPSGGRSARRRPSFDETAEDEYAGESTRQQLLNETTQMRAQLDDYEDNLNDVNDKMKRTNQILNIVLIVLIIALTFVLAVVVYWVLLSKGIIS